MVYTSVNHETVHHTLARIVSCHQVDPSTMWQDKSESTRCRHVYPEYWELVVEDWSLVGQCLIKINDYIYSFRYLSAVENITNLGNSLATTNF